jgi:N-acetylneuraminic acid mutarotase
MRQFCLILLAAAASAGSASRKADLPAGAPFPFQQPTAIGNRIYAVLELTVFEYDAAADRWTDRKAPLPVKRHHYGVAAADGKVYAIGGCTGENETDPHNPIADVHAFDPATGKWTTKAPLPAPRRNLSAVAIDGLVYVVGGSDLGAEPKPVLVYDPRRDAWRTTKAVSNVIGCWGAHAIGRKIYAVGTRQDPANPGALPFRTDEIDTVAETATARRPIGVPRGGHTSAALGGKLYVLGGAVRGGKPASDVEAYDPATDTWTRAVDLTLPRSWMGAVTFQDAIWLLGGVNTKWETPERLVEVYRP